jgi:hypothetical protein
MQSSIPFPVIQAPPSHATPAPVNVVLAYENLSAALWAGEILARLLQQIPGARNLSPWSFSCLHDPESHGEATTAVVQADWIVVATSSGNRPLPDAIEGWLKHSLAKRGGGGAVTGLSKHGNAPASTSSITMQILQRVAEEAGCGFFTHHEAAAQLNVA